MKKLVTPLINLNGNSATDLVEKLQDVLIGIENLQRAIGNANDVTHGRNFQHVSGDIHRQLVDDACHAWGERRQMLADLHQELLEMALAIQAQGRR